MWEVLGLNPIWDIGFFEYEILSAVTILNLCIDDNWIVFNQCFLSYIDILYFLAPNLKGRKRKKRSSMTGENGESDSNEVSSEYSIPTCPKEKVKL